MFRKLEWKKKLLFVYSFMCSVCLIAFFITVNAVEKNYTYDNFTFSSNTAFGQMKNYIQYRIDELVQECYSLAYNNVVTEVLSRDQTDIKTQLTDLSDVRSLYYKRLGENKNQITRITLYMDRMEGDENITSSHIQFKSFQAAKETPWYAAMMNSKARLFCCGEQYTGDADSISIFHTISSDKDYTLLVAAVQIDVPKESFSEILRGGTTTENASCSILNSMGDYICCSDIDKADLDGISLQALYDTGNKEAERQYLNIEKIKYTDWFLVQSTPISDFTALSRSNTFSLFLVLIITLIVCWFATSLLSTFMTKRILALSNRMRNYRASKAYPLGFQKDGDEVDHLIESYDNMIGEIDELTQRDVENNRKIMQGELTLLYEQINPHFLFNTLDILNWLIIKGNNEKASETLVDLIQFYRFGLNKGRKLVKLQEELKHVEHYIRIQNTRFENKVEFEVDIPEDLMEILIPKITLQPVVENALIHGLRNSSNGKIKIYAEKKDDDVVIRVLDNGVGIPAFELNQLYSEKSGYGLRNLDERLKLEFGDKYGITVSSTIHEFTCVEILVPSKRDD